MSKNIDDVIEILNLLDMSYMVTHTNDYSELFVPRNNELVSCVILFDCGSREIANVLDEEED